MSELIIIQNRRVNREEIGSRQKYQNIIITLFYSMNNVTVLYDESTSFSWQSDHKYVYYILNTTGKFTKHTHPIFIFVYNINLKKLYVKCKTLKKLHIYEKNNVIGYYLLSA